MSDMVKHPETYFSGFIPERDGLLRKLEAEAEKEQIPIIGPVVGELLFVLARATGATSILELGTATGYSAVYLGRACAPAGGRMVTLENDPDMAARAERNLQEAGLSETVSVRTADALATLPKLEGPFDFVFLDIEKKDYQPALSALSRIVRPGGLLIADNTGFRDTNAFNRAIFDNPAWRSVQILSFLPMHSASHDGLCFAVHVPEE
ncbi:MAG: O-methyltransferase [Desulfobacterales bacterium]|nr:O-methyltransferase [Desulfobacterales bacterium]